MIPSWPLRLFLDCSTAHLSPATRDLLDAQALRGDALIAATPYGWFLWVREAADPDHPPDLARIEAEARALGARYILFDRDAPVSDALPIFEE